MVNLIKQIAGLDLMETRRGQSGTLNIEGPNSRHSVTLTASGSSKGQFLRLDLDEQARITMNSDTLGLLPAQLDLPQ